MSPEPDIYFYLALAYIYVLGQTLSQVFRQGIILVQQISYLSKGMISVDSSSCQFNSTYNLEFFIKSIFILSKIQQLGNQCFVNYTNIILTGITGFKSHFFPQVCFTHLAFQDFPTTAKLDDEPLYFLTQLDLVHYTDTWQKQKGL